MQKKWVLVAEDELDIRENLVDLIQSHNSTYKVILAENGKEALAKAQNQTFDCIITDINMPLLDGEGLIHQIKGSRNNSKCPIIIVSSTASPKVLQEYEYLWMIQKPFASKDILENLDIQIRLGKTDKRLSAQLVNCATSLLKETLTENRLSFEINKVVKMDSTSSISGEHFYPMRIKFCDTFFWFFLGCENQDFLKYNLFSLFVEKINAQKVLPGPTQVDLSFYIDQVKKSRCTSSGFSGLSIEFSTELGSVWLEATYGREFYLS